MTASGPLPTLLVIPTGIGCELGGYAGDGLPAARLLAAASSCLITHPNVMNAASLYWSDRRIHYVEGWALDRFAAGELALAPRASQRVGVLLDAGIEPELVLRHRQVIDACRASLGLPIGPHTERGAVEAARSQWKAARAEGCAVTYWQQTEAGRWEKRA